MKVLAIFSEALFINFYNIGPEIKKWNWGIIATATFIIFVVGYPFIRLGGKSLREFLREEKRKKRKEKRTKLRMLVKKAREQEKTINSLLERISELEKELVKEKRGFAKERVELMKRVGKLEDFKELFSLVMPELEKLRTMCSLTLNGRDFSNLIVRQKRLGDLITEVLNKMPKAKDFPGNEQKEEILEVRIRTD